VPKSPIEEVSKQIEADLLKAVDLLPESYGAADRGRVSKGTALGLLTKLYMYWEKLPEAIATGQKVISNSQLMHWLPITPITLPVQMKIAPRYCSLSRRYKT
jgi:hypothetical protein